MSRSFFFLHILFLFRAILHQIDERSFTNLFYQDTLFFVRFCHFLLVETIRDNVYSSVHRARALDLLVIDFFFLLRLDVKAEGYKSNWATVSIEQPWSHDAATKRGSAEGGGIF